MTYRRKKSDKHHGLNQNRLRCYMFRGQHESLYHVANFFRYHHFYLQAKGNQFKNKRVLIEAIHNAKAEALKQKAAQEQLEARRAKAASVKEKKRVKNAEKAKA